MSAWTIIGQSGKALGSASVDLEVTNYSDVKLTTTNQGTDTLSFFVRSESRTADPSYLPEFQQQISLFKSGTRQFTGYVNKPKFIMQGGIFGWQIEAQNGWPELDRVTLSAADKEYVRAQGSLTATVQDIINKAIAAGARISLGSVAAMFDIPAISFRGTSCGAALVELLKIAADAVAYFDYSGAGNPALVVVRRGAMTAKTFTFGTDDITEPFSCSPVPGSTPTKVTVAYATRDLNGIVTEYVQAAGTGADVQSVILAGSNFADFQSKATAGQIALQTSTAATWANIYALDPKLKDIAGILAPNGTGSVGYWGGTSGDKTWRTLVGDNTGFYGMTAPNTAPLVKGEWREYMAAVLGMSKGEAKVRVDFFWVRREKTTNFSGSSVENHDRPDWFLSLMSAGAYIASTPVGVYAISEETQAGDPPNHRSRDTSEILRYRAEFSVTAISRSLAALTTFRDPGDYGTIAPPVDLAANLLAAQSFVPYEGEFGLAPAHTAERLLSRKVSFGGLTARLAAIGALIQSETFDVETGAKTVQMGLAARSGGSALGRLRKLSE